MNEENVSYYAVIPADVRYDERLTPNAKLLYGEITALCNQKGYCWASNDYFAKLYRVSKVSISNWISSLIKCGYISSEIIKSDKKVITERRLTILTSIKDNFNTPQNYFDGGIKNNFNTLPKKTLRGIEENFKDNNTSNTKSNSKNNNTVIKSDFEYLWSLYPKKKGSKTAAFKSYEKAVKNGVTKETVETAIKAFIADCKRNNTPDKFIPYGSTWFSQERWNDSYESATVTEDYEGGENILDELGDFYSDSRGT